MFPDLAPRQTRSSLDRVDRDSTGCRLAFGAQLDRVHRVIETRSSIRSTRSSPSAMKLAVGRVTDDEVVEDERSPLFPRKLDRVIIPLYSRRSRLEDEHVIVLPIAIGTSNAAKG